MTQAILSQQQCETLERAYIATPQHDPAHGVLYKEYVISGCKDMLNEQRASQIRQRSFLIYGGVAAVVCAAGVGYLLYRSSRRR